MCNLSLFHRILVCAVFFPSVFFHVCPFCLSISVSLSVSSSVTIYLHILFNQSSSLYPTQSPSYYPHPSLSIYPPFMYLYSVHLPTSQPSHPFPTVSETPPARVLSSHCLHPLCSHVLHQLSPSPCPPLTVLYSVSLNVLFCLSVYFSVFLSPYIFFFVCLPICLPVYLKA